MDTDTDPGGPKICGSYGSGSATLLSENILKMVYSSWVKCGRNPLANLSRACQTNEKKSLGKQSYRARKEVIFCIK
jgi:hypothetical protein